MELLDRVLLSNTVRSWIVALAIGVATWIVARLILVVLRKRLAKYTGATRTVWDDIALHVASKTKVIFLFAMAVMAGSHALTLPSRARSGIDGFAIIVALVQAGIWVVAGLRFGLGEYQKTLMERDRSAVTTIGALAFVGQVVVWAVVLLLCLDNLGVNVTALIAGLGIGGVAVALALQTVLGDLLSSLAIVLDKPFVLGDFIDAGNDYSGSVERIGLKTTRIRSLWGEQLVFSNSELLKGRIRNYGRMRERRIAFTIGVTYETPVTMLREIPAMIQAAIGAQEGTRFDRSHFAGLGDSALTFDTVYWVTNADYTVYRNIQQAINLRLVEQFGEKGIEFAYPTQTLYLAKPEPEADAAKP